MENLTKKERKAQKKQQIQLKKLEQQEISQQLKEQQQQQSDDNENFDSSDSDQSQITKTQKSLKIDLGIIEGKQYLLIFNKIGNNMIISGDFKIIPLVGDIDINGYIMKSQGLGLNFQQVKSLKGANYLSIKSINNLFTTKKQQQSSHIFEEIMENLGNLKNINYLEKIIDQVSQEKNQIQKSKFNSVMLVEQNNELLDFNIEDNFTQNSVFLKQRSDFINFNKNNTKVSILEQNLIKNKNQKIMVVGGKNSGKSSLCHYITNYLISTQKQKKKIFFLDTDLGQGMYNFPGTVNLYSIDYNNHVITNYGKSLTIEPFASFQIGEFSPQNFIPNYLKAVQQCMDIYNDNFKDSNLIVNTCGYINNIGEIIMLDLIKYIQPNILYLLNSEDSQLKNSLNNNNKQNYKQGVQRISLNNSNKNMIQKRFQDINIICTDFKESQQEQQKMINNKKQKKDQTMFNIITQNDMEATYNNISKSEQQVYSIDIQNLQYQINGVGLDSKKSSQIGLIFLNSIVGIYKTGNTTNTIINSSSNNNINKIQQQQDNLNNITIGYGFITDINFENNQIYIMTNLSQQQLNEVGGIYKFTELEFSKSFTNSKIESIISQNEIMMDYQSDCQFERNIFTPFVLPNTSGIGTQSFRNRVSIRQSK